MVHLPYPVLFLGLFLITIATLISYKQSIQLTAAKTKLKSIEKSLSEHQNSREVKVILDAYFGKKTKEEEHKLFGLKN